MRAVAHVDFLAFVCISYQYIAVFVTKIVMEEK